MTTLQAVRQSEFAVSYEGPAFVEHAMPVRDLAPALLALGQAFERANGLLNGGSASVSLSIRATRPGSFEVALFLEQVLEGTGDVLTHDLFSSAADLTGIVVGGSTVGVGLIALIKKLRGKKPKIEPQLPEGVVFEADNVRFIVSTEVARLYGDKPMRDQLEAFVRPLAKEGVQRVTFRRGQTELESVEREEAEYFNTDAENTNVTEYVIPRQRLQIASLAFNREGKWRLSDGANTRWYAMGDEAFAKSIQMGRRFGKDDILVCEVLMTQRISEAGKLRLDYSVLRVLQHVTPSEQLRLLDPDLN